MKFRLTMSNVNDEQNVNDGLDVIGVVPLRRSLRQISPPVRFQDYDVFPDTAINVNGEIAKYKARLFVKGFLQKPGLDFNEVYAPVARIETVRLIVAIASMRKWTVSQLDVKSAFLNGPLEEELYTRQPPGYEKISMEDRVMKLNKTLYGLKQAP